MSRLAIVTGGNRGIGLEIARQLSRSDIFVVIGSRDGARAAATAVELNTTLLGQGSKPIVGLDNDSVAAVNIASVVDCRLRHVKVLTNHLRLEVVRPSVFRVDRRAVRGRSAFFARRRPMMT